MATGTRLLTLNVKELKIMKLKELLKVKGLNTQHGGNVGTRPPKFPLIRT